MGVGTRYVGKSERIARGTDGDPRGRAGPCAPAPRRACVLDADLERPREHEHEPRQQRPQGLAGGRAHDDAEEAGPDQQAAEVPAPDAEHHDADDDDDRRLRDPHHVDQSDGEGYVPGGLVDPALEPAGDEVALGQVPPPRMG
jgi:hypothetical protein